MRYNQLNLPILVDLGNNNQIEYLYDAAGIKLQQRVYKQGNLEKVTDYVGNFVYENSSLKFIITDEGRLLNREEDTGYDYEYFIKDHLGNNRVTVSDQNNDGIAEVMQEDHYYPFGMAMEGMSYQNPLQQALNKYLYNGKELQDDLGLGLYDYGARFYDAQIGRWHSLDPLAEIYNISSPYSYVENNPISFIDPNGMFKSKFGAWWYKLWNGGDGIGKDKGGEYFVYTDNNSAADDDDDVDVVSKRVFDRRGRNWSNGPSIYDEVNDYLNNYEYQQRNEEGLRNGTLAIYDSRYDARMAQLSAASSLLLPSPTKALTQILNKAPKTVRFGPKSFNQFNNVKSYTNLEPGFTNIVAHGSHIQSAEQLSKLLDSKGITGNLRLIICGGAKYAEALAGMRNVKVLATYSKVSPTKSGFIFYKRIIQNGQKATITGTEGFQMFGK